jgi:DNA-directed RNA polymerase subunit RPC12/RpoP
MGARKTKYKSSTFQKIEGVKKVIRCVSCGERIVVKNFNQIKCEKCGYRGVYKPAKA